MATDFYQLLALEPDADLREIKKSFRLLAQHVHPDKVRDLPAHEQAQAKELYHRLHEAYTVLARPETRSLYDECRRRGRDFAAAMAGPRPETPAEARAREQADAAAQRAQEATLERIERGLARLDPTRTWRRSEETYEYFDRVLESRQGTRRDVVHVKLLAQLSSADLPGVVAHADAMLEAPVEGMVLDHYGYLLLGRSLAPQPDLERQVEAFNARAHGAVTGRRPRAWLAVGAGEAPTLVHPGTGPMELDPASILAGGAVATRAPPPVAARDEERTPAPGGPTILVVDDDPLVQATMTDLLEGRGYQVVTARDWASFRQVMLAQPVAVILLDVNLPHVSGDKLALFVRSSPEIDPKPPILLHSGLEEGELRRLARRVGALNFLTKGSDDERVLRVVAAAVAAGAA